MANWSYSVQSSDPAPLSIIQSMQLRWRLHHTADASGAVPCNSLRVLSTEPAVTGLPGVSALLLPLTPALYYSRCKYMGPQL